MDNTLREQIGELADNLREELGLTIPVDVEKAVKLLGGSVTYGEVANYAEAQIFKRDDDSFVICLNENVVESKIKKRLSLAHEIGHLILNMGYRSPERWENTEDYVDSVYYRDGYASEEDEAHEFANAFLMPKKEFIEKAKENYNYGNSCYELVPIADYFELSTYDVLARGRRLGIFDWD